MVVLSARPSTIFHLTVVESCHYQSGSEQHPKETNVVISTSKSNVVSCTFLMLDFGIDKPCLTAYNTDNRSHIKPVLHQLHWFPVSERIKYKLLNPYLQSHPWFCPKLFFQLTHLTNSNSLTQISQWYSPKATKI